MIDLDIFGRGEIKRLNYELRQSSYKVQELENENKYLRGVKTAQAATIDRIVKELRAQDELIRQMQGTERKIFQMYNASEAARQELMEKARRIAAETQREPVPAADESYKLGPLHQKGTPVTTEAPV